MDDTPYDDLSEVLRRAFPQGTALLHHEHGGAILSLGARDLISDARLAVDVLGPRGAKNLAHALLAVGQRHVAVAERMIDLAAATPETRGENRASAPGTAAPHSEA